MVSVIKCGTKCRFKLASIEGIITCIYIRNEYVTYDVSYFVNGEGKTQMFNEYEIEPIDDDEKIKIGFIP